MSLPNSNERLLIVDDDPAIREILLEFLGHRYECDAAGSAEEALALLGAQRFQLVVSDIAMPRMSGLEMIPHVRALAPDTLVVMVSGSQAVESAVEAMRAGAFDYIVKPFDLGHVEEEAVPQLPRFGRGQPGKPRHMHLAPLDGKAHGQQRGRKKHQQQHQSKKKIF